MIECYYIACKYHSKDEPFCSELQCLAKKEELAEFIQSRKDFLKKTSSNFEHAYLAEGLK